ncbi:MAG: hypothetical protein CL678_08160 [Bdellovibrionaceae bacterium]|nr:hypothetical protein [Pseudobdellovibrionaceae bacterium]|tara:strand:+ start:2775 stop:3524 length:750 start_codon:yes stop_codon:yes gene_type:complete
MNAFWWFEENKIAGMARPGFNHVHWSELPFEEAVLMGWIGGRSSGTYSRAEFLKHLLTYCPKISLFYDFDEEKSLHLVENLNSLVGLSNVFERFLKKTRVIENFKVTEDSIFFEISKKRLNEEISYFKDRGIKKIIALTEIHHNKDFLSQYFDVYHFSVPDLEVPTFEQVIQISDLLKKSKEEPIGIHCLAGIGRTSTMLIATHLVLGFSLEELKKIISIKNPSYQLMGVQGKFIEEMDKKLSFTQKLD